MKQTDQIWKKYVVRMAFIFAMMGFCLLNKAMYAQAADGAANKPQPVKVVCIDYEKGIIQIEANNNTKVYYSDSKQKTWNMIEGENGDILNMDISWISAAKDYELNLKGSDDETVVEVDLPKYNSKLKAKFNKVEGTIDFTNEDGASEFEWRKAAALDKWNRVPIDLNEPDAEEFLKEIEMMRAKGGKIQVRIPQKAGTSEADVGCRPSKVVTVSVAKRGNAPSVKVTAKTMTVNTTDKMEYRIVSVGGEQETNTWATCDKKMNLADLTPQVLTVSGTSVVGKDVIVAIRKAETEKAAYTKTNYLSVPAQPEAPDASTFVTTKNSSKFGLTIGNASKTTPYQYAVLAKGDTKDFSKLSWKSVTSTKEISFTSKKYPEGSTIYVRTQGVNLSKNTELKLPSDYTTVSISYLTEATE